ncbi:hypothetical protein R1sor_017607 [Riccia sorocarpa]|uniref:Uncharacterized protein n=1 Tax=Riccia sorocarpa TaxID=122646 RepID=A0ABD3I7B4_9MARC
MDFSAEAVEALKFHRKQQAEERTAAGRRRWKALDSPNDCVYIQIDGMDQKKTALPHFSKQPKDQKVDQTDTKYRPLVGRQESEVVRHVQAIRQHIQTYCYPFFDDEQKDWWNHWFVLQEEIGKNIRNNRRERLVGDMCWFWPVPPERDEHVVDEPVAMTTTEEFRRRIFGQRRPIYSGPRQPPPGSAAADCVAHIGELTEIHEKSFLAVLAND